MRILFLGGGYTSHLMVIAHSLKSVNSSIVLDYLSEKEPPVALHYEFPFPMDNVIIIKKNFPGFLYKIPKIRSALKYFDYKKTLDTIPSQYYDYVHFEFIDPWNCKFISEFKKMSKTTIATPWGSDVYRVPIEQREVLVRFFKDIDIVTSMNDVMTQSLINIYQVDKRKIISIPVVGTMALDNIVNCEDISKDIAKQQLGLTGRFTIVCGTNATPAQQHCKILAELTKIKDLLPKETTLLILLGRDKVYDQGVLKAFDESGFDYKCFQRRITDQEMLFWRKASDVMIHAQPSDSESGAMMEALLCGTTIVNAAWLHYPKLEKWGAPYYIFNSFDDLSQVVLNAVKNVDNLQPKEELINFLKSYTLKNVAEKINGLYCCYNSK